jgi:hypothetical protein
LEEIGGTNKKAGEEEEDDNVTSLPPPAKERRERTWKAGKTVLILGIVFIVVGLIFFIPLLNLGTLMLIIVAPILLILGRKRTVKNK